MDNYKVKISNSHVNSNKEITDVSIINLLQDIEGIHIASLNLFNKYLNDNNLGVFLLYRQVDIIRRANFNEEVLLTTYPFLTKRSSGYRHIYMYDSNHNPLVKTTSFGAYVNLLTYMPQRIPDEIIKTIKDGKKDESVEVLSRKIDFEITENKLINKQLIKKSHIDRYNHVNNAHYLSFALDGLEEFVYNRIRMMYQKSFLLNDLVKVYLNTQENGVKVVTLTNEFDEIYAIMEFSNIKH